jgi:hypothetical protein
MGAHERREGERTETREKILDAARQSPSYPSELNLPNFDLRLDLQTLADEISAAFCPPVSIQYEIKAASL